MIQVFAVIEDIDYGVMTMHVQKRKEHGVLVSLFSTLGMGILLNPFVLRKAVEHPSILKHQIKKLAGEYGVSLSALEIGDNVIEDNGADDRGKYKISITINHINYDKLAGAIGKAKGKIDEAASEASEAAKIIKPFISTTMATVPPQAVVELFEVLGRDRLIKLAGDYGVTVESVAVEMVSFSCSYSSGLSNSIGFE